MTHLDSHRPRWHLPDLTFGMKPRRLSLLGSKVLGAIVLIFAFLSHDLYTDGALAEVAFKSIASLLLFSSAMGRCWTTAYISGKKASVLVQEGPYSMVRHPLYVFSLLGYVAAGLAFQSLVISAAMGLVFFATHWHNILHEEKCLQQTFGREFDDYCSRVPRFLPKPWLLTNPSSISVAPARFSRTVLESSLLSLVL
ncbi:MAG TPA: isoprenylcysteine carboxylmethyltransferase family protein, partial [Thermoanaerobaculia bacterium]|nr:isoprenylcysteine carboxylmethyltransferase family protein [Thermoanaerobaculia bacterium]